MVNGLKLFVGLNDYWSEECPNNGAGKETRGSQKCREFEMKIMKVLQLMVMELPRMKTGKGMTGDSWKTVN